MFAQDDLKAIFSAFSMDYHAWRAGKIGADLKSVAALLLCFWDATLCVVVEDSCTLPVTGLRGILVQIFY